jgi:hypothetical protein
MATCHCERAMLRAYTVVVLLSLSVCAHAVPRLPDQIMLDNIQLQRCSSAEVKALLVFKVGYASVFMPDCAALTTDFYGSIKQLSFEYERAVPGDAFAKSAANFLKKNLAPETWTALEDKINAFNAHYKDIGPGDRYDLVYLPNQGLRLLLNDELLVAESDPLLAQAYFTIWFGDKPFDKGLKSKLLTQG